MENNIKIVMVGDSGAGKTSLIMSMSNLTFTTEYIPTVFHNSINITHNNINYTIRIMDIVGHDDYDPIIPPNYQDNDIFIFCASNSDQLSSLKSKWYIKMKQPKNIIFVHTKCDTNGITDKQIKEISLVLKPKCIVSCSSMLTFKIKLLMIKIIEQYIELLK
ncbi:Rac/Rho-like_protein [Hexamita inflata]|uniref:Rac/Rho-like_protein n=1 Tax=Hexamita inflata TaxID=28002 RepID=A0ABP1I449_9EUKA